MTQVLAKRPLSANEARRLALQAIRLAPELKDSTKAKYTAAVERYCDAGHHLLDAAALRRYASTASASERAFLSAAVKRLAGLIESQAKNGATPDNVSAVQAAVYRCQAITEAIEVKQGNGEKSHTWLAQAEVRELLATCDRDTLKGQRDHLALALLVGAGLRRREATQLRFSDVKQQPDRVILDIVGKGSKKRPVPISDRLARAIEEWQQALGAEDDSRVLRSFRRGGHVNGSISTQALYNITQEHGEQIGKPELQPHDLRRSYARIGYDAGCPIGDISLCLGHESIRTTQRYLGLESPDCDDTPSDYVPI